MTRATDTISAGGDLDFDGGWLQVAEVRDAVQRLDGEAVLRLWAEPPDDDAALSQAVLRWPVQNAVATRGAGRDLKRWKWRKKGRSQVRQVRQVQSG